MCCFHYSSLFQSASELLHINSNTVNYYLRKR
ncbi:hypothetical protein VPHK567_0169 [Vibrio phage K567]